MQKEFPFSVSRVQGFLRDDVCVFFHHQDFHREEANQNHQDRGRLWADAEEDEVSEGPAAAAAEAEAEEAEAKAEEEEEDASAPAPVESYRHFLRDGVYVLIFCGDGGAAVYVSTCCGSFMVSAVNSLLRR